MEERRLLLAELKAWMERAVKVFPGLVLFIKTYLGWKL